MAGGKQLGTVVAKIGADSTSFQEAVNAAGVSMRGFEAEAARAGAQVTNGIQNPMLLAGKVAGQFSGEVTTASNQMIKAIGGVDDATRATVGSVASLSDNVLAGASAFANLGNQTINFTKLSPAAALSMAGLAAATLGITYELTTLLDKYTGFTNFLKDKAAPPTSEYAELLAKSEERFRGAAAQVDLLTSKLKLSGPEWEYSSEHTAANAARVAELHDKLLGLAAAQNRQSIATREQTEATAALTQTQWDQAAAFAAQADATAQYYGVLTRGDVEESMGKLVEDFVLLVERGASAGELMQGFSSKIEDVAASASTYRDLDVPSDFERLRDAVQSGSVFAVEDLATALKDKLPEGARAGSEAARKALEEASELYADSLSGGIGRGIQDGVSAGDQAIVAWMRELASRPVQFNLKMNYEILAQQLRALGLEVPYSGEVPA